MANYEEPTVTSALPRILRDLIVYGDDVGSRNGRVKEFLNQQIVITDPTKREVLSTKRKANVFAQIAETMWVLSGRNDIKWLSAYLPRAKDYSDDGETWRGGYGPRLRHWRGIGWATGRPEVDQLAHVVETLKADPLSRRAVIAIYDPAADIPAGKDVPCNDFLQFQSRLGKLHLTVTVRSNDVMWGWSGINAFEWSTLQEIVASLLGIHVGPLTFNIGSLHLYEQHWDKANIIGSYRDVRTRDLDHIPFNPNRRITSLGAVDLLLDSWFTWEALCRTGDITMTTLNGIEDPLFKAWAQAIAYYWTRDDVWLAGIKDTALHAAILATPASVLPEPVQRPASNVPGLGTANALNETTRAFYKFVCKLHAAKHASYGDSWKKRGEEMSIIPNIARKVDRLGVGDQYDSSADTLIDFWVYLAKYWCWMGNMDEGPENVNLRLAWSLGEAEGVAPEADWETQIPKDFDIYVGNLTYIDDDVALDWVKNMVRRAAPIARDLWLAETAGDEYWGADHE